MFDRLDLFREDTPTPTPARADAAPDERAQPREAPTGAPRRDRDHPAPDDRARHARAGHRREHNPDARDRPRRSRTERTRDAIADVGLYRAVSYRDLSDRHFDGHPFTTRRLVTQMKQAGLIEEHEARGPQGNTFTVLTATERGKDAAHRAAVAAQALGLPMQDTRVMYPDAQLEIEDAEGRSGRVHVEIASDHYHAAAIVAKAGAGFAMHGSSRSATRNIGRALGRAAARETDSGPGGGGAHAGRDGSVEL